MQNVMYLNLLQAALDERAALALDMFVYRVRKYHQQPTHFDL
jgi:hypothetical protein